MDTFDIIHDTKIEIFRLEALLKAIRCAAFHTVEQPSATLTLPPEDFPYLLDIAIDRLNLINDHTDQVETDIKKIRRGKA